MTSVLPPSAGRMLAVSKLYERLSWPFVTFFYLWNPRIHPKYEMTWRKKVALARRVYRNWCHIRTGLSYKAHLAIAAKLLEIPPGTTGAVVECGSWLGGTTTNLSVICDVVGRDLIVYDSFEGLPAQQPGDAMPIGVRGQFKGTLEEVQDNVRRYGVIERCSFRKGWFADTLPHHTEPIVLCLVDVDLKSSMHDCIVNLWPHLTEQGYLFFDEFTRLDNCALFFSERFWREHFDAPPPGLMGSGTGVGAGQYYLGPWKAVPVLQEPTSVAFT